MACTHEDPIKSHACALCSLAETPQAEHAHKEAEFQAAKTIVAAVSAPAPAIELVATAPAPAEDLAVADAPAPSGVPELPGTLSHTNQRTNASSTAQRVQRAVCLSSCIAAWDFRMMTACAQMHLTGSSDRSCLAAAAVSFLGLPAIPLPYKDFSAEAPAPEFSPAQAPAPAHETGADVVKAFVGHYIEVRHFSPPHYARPRATSATLL